MTSSAKSGSLWVLTLQAMLFVTRGLGGKESHVTSTFFTRTLLLPPGGVNENSPRGDTGDGPSQGNVGRRVTTQGVSMSRKPRRMILEMPG